MIYRQMKMICSAHKKRGEQVKEFNLSPHYFKYLKKFTITYDGREIPIICEGWKRVEKFYYLEMETTHGLQIANTLVYRLL